VTSTDNQKGSNPDYIISVWTNETPHITHKLVRSKTLHVGKDSSKHINRQNI